MTAEEIRKHDGYSYEADIAIFVREIAAQLAELNEHLRQCQKDGHKVEIDGYVETL